MHSAFRSQNLYSGWFHQACQPHWVLEVSLLSSSSISSFTLAKWSSVLSSQRQYLIQPRGRKYSCKISISSTFLAVQDQFTTNILIGMPTNKIQKSVKIGNMNKQEAITLGKSSEVSQRVWFTSSVSMRAYTGQFLSYSACQFPHNFTARSPLQSERSPHSHFLMTTRGPNQGSPSDI